MTTPFVPTVHDEDAARQFSEKMKAWRAGEGISFTFSGRNGHIAQRDFHNEVSHFQQARDQVKLMQDAGIPFELKGHAE